MPVYAAVMMSYQQEFLTSVVFWPVAIAVPIGCFVLFFSSLEALILFCMLFITRYWRFVPDGLGIIM